MTQRPTDRCALLAGAALAALAAGSASAQVDIAFDVERSGAVTRLELIYPESEGGDLSAEAEILGGAVLVATLSEAAAADAGVLVDAAPDLIARARIDPDGRTLRLALNAEVTPRVSVSHNIIAIDLMGPGATPLPDIVSPFELARRAEQAEQARQAALAAAQAAAPDPALPVEVRSGEASEYTRIEFVWPQPVSYSLEQEGDRARLFFDRAAEADLRRLLATPPRLVDAVTDESDDRSLALVFDLAAGAQARVWGEEGRVVFDIVDPASAAPADLLTALAEYADAQAAALMEPEETEAVPGEREPVATDASVELAAAEPAEPAEAGPAAASRPVPADDAVRAAVQSDADALALSFAWGALPGAAVFRRADAIWLVFDASAELDLDEMAAADRRFIEGYQAWRSGDYSAVRFEAPASTLADIQAAGSTWTIRFTQTLAEPPRVVRLSRETRYNAPGRIDIALEGARSVRAIADPVIGDTLLVVTADGEKRGIVTERRLVEAVFLPSVHGVAIKPLADDLSAEIVAGGAMLSRPGGLALSRNSDPSTGVQIARPDSPAFLDFAGWRGQDDFRTGRRTLERRASSFEPDALLALARFYLSWELAPEALGVADLAVEQRPQLADSAEVRALRGAASFLMGRTDIAKAYFSGPQMRADSAVRPWLGLIAAQEGRWSDARAHFEAGADTLFFLTPLWQARVHAAEVRAAVETNDLGTAQMLLGYADGAVEDPAARAQLEFARARLIAATGNTANAIDRFAALGRSEYEPIQAPALLEKIRLEIDAGLITPTEGAEALESLRYRWRGDSTEVETARLLGDLYARAGRYREALDVWQTARTRHPRTRLARAMGEDMDHLFRRLYIEGEAERLDPLEALALWYEHQELTPQGEEGDRVVRRVASRLEAVDLLDQAAGLLAHQIEERQNITGYGKAQIAVDLARLYLMAGRAEDALRAIQSTRIAGLPGRTVEARRLLEARALAELGRREHAIELIANETSREAELLRADIAWDMADWAGAGRRLESAHGERWRNSGPLQPDEAHDILRAAIAYALAEDETSVARLEARYGSAMEQTRFASAFGVVTEEIGRAGDARLVDLVSQLGAMEGVDSFLAGFTRRFVPEAEPPAPEAS